MKHPWHCEFYGIALKEMIAHAKDKPTDGWLEFFRTKYPEQYKKYADANVKIVDLWGKTDSVSLEEFKNAVKVEVDATKWALNKFNEERVSVAAGNCDGGKCDEVTISWTEKKNIEEAVECR